MKPSKTSNPYDQAIRHCATALLGYLRLPGGVMPDVFMYSLFELWGKADDANKAIIKTGWPFIGFVLTVNDIGDEADLRSIAAD